jgi:lactobin A/cerein 7B family class IIb bacteriocin
VIINLKIMQNLKIEGLEDLEANELESTNGGIIPLLAVWIIAEVATVGFSIGFYNGYQNAAAR